MILYILLFIYGLPTNIILSIIFLVPFIVGMGGGDMIDMLIEVLQDVSVISKKIVMCVLYSIPIIISSLIFLSPYIGLWTLYFYKSTIPGLLDFSSEHLFIFISISIHHLIWLIGYGIYKLYNWCLEK